MSDTEAIQVYLTNPQKKKFENNQTFQLSSTQLGASSGKHHVEIVMPKDHHRKLMNNVRLMKGYRFTDKNIVGGSLLDFIKPHAKNVAKSVVKAYIPTALDYVGKKTGHKNITDAVKPSVNGVVDAIAGGKVGGKGSPEAKEKMARIRAMRKGVSIDGGNIGDDIRNGWNRTFNPALGRKIVKALRSPIAKKIYKGVADLGATAIGDFTGNPVAGFVGAEVANHLIDGLGIKGKGKGSQAMRDRMAQLRALRKPKRLNI